MSTSNSGKDGTKKPRHPNSLKNLKPVKKGEIRNPLGQASHNPLTMALRRISKEAYCQALSVAFSGKEEDLEELISSPHTPMLEKFVAKAMLDAFSTGNFSFVERIADRLIGKVADEMKIENSGSTNVMGVLAAMPAEDLKARLAKLREDV